MKDMIDMNQKSEANYRVSLSHEGLRRAYDDNALHLAALRRNEAVHAVMTWIAVIGFGVLLGWSACNGVAT